MSRLRGNLSSISFLVIIVIFLLLNQLSEFSSRLFPQRNLFEECIAEGPYKFKKWVPREAGNREILSLVQGLYAPSGLASLCDWIIGSRLEHWGRLPQYTSWGNIQTLPRTIFIQRDELVGFTQHLFPCFPWNSTKIILITGDHDKTTPRSC